MAEITLTQFITTIILSGIISVDRVAGLNIMISRPVIVSGILGMLYGDIITALMMGLIFEFIGMLEVPVGTTITHDDTFGGYVSSLIILLGIINRDVFSILTTIFVISILMYPVTYSDKFFRSINNHIIRKNISTYEEVQENKLIILGISLAFLRGVLVYNAGFLVVFVIMKYFNSLIADIHIEGDSILALTVIAAFMFGYILRFLIVNRVYQVIILSLGLITGWLLL